jgi:hypothetical protein
MSVPSSKRKPSTALFLIKLRDLEVLTIKKCDSKAKKHKAFLNENIIKPAANAFSCAKAGNAIYAVTETDFIERRSLMLKSMSYLQIYSAQLDVFFELYRTDGFSFEEFENLSKLMADARNLLSSIIKSDRDKEIKMLKNKDKK